MSSRHWRMSHGIAASRCVPDTGDYVGREGWTVRTVQGRVLARNPVEGSTEVMARKVRERTISNHRNLTFAVKLFAFGR